MNKDTLNKDTPKTILIVDNDRHVQDIIRQVVKKMGYQTVAVEQATRALRVLMEEKVDAILLDLHMPGPHGEHLLTFMKKKNLPLPPTIVVSGYLQRDIIGELIRLGVSGIIAKPFEIRRLMDELRRVLEGQATSRFVFCPQCGTGTSAGDEFCRQCGGTLERRQPCSHCNTLNEPGNRFCDHCGASMAEV